MGSKSEEKEINRKLAEINGAVGSKELAVGLAEECAELAQAAIKFRRCFSKENPTPKPLDEVIDNFYEEVADVILYLDAMSVNWGTVHGHYLQKLDRWHRRLRGK